jgi:hypothetical protein
MITHTKPRTIEVDALGGYERRVFSIKPNGQAFRTLIDGLYSNKIGAVVRELWANAIDSHVEAGQTRPFQVDVPTLLDPTFRIRDFGVSLSHDDVMVLYSTIFESTKRETNDQVGEKGLGSKSPFAYGDTFMVVAYLDGLKRTYVANIMDDDLPEIRHLSTELTDEPQGFEVSIPVGSQDFRKFEREILRMLLATDTRPEVSGLSITVPEPVLAGDGWRIFGQSFDMGEFAVRQGCVMYSVPTVHTQIAYGHLFVADVPIGSCETTASRESLSMDAETEQAVHDAHIRAWAGVKTFMQSLTYKNRLDEFQQRNRYSFVQGFPVKQYVSLSPDKANKNFIGQAIFVYNANKVTKPAWGSSFSNPEDLGLIVDDVTASGAKMLRRQLRIKSYVKSMGGKVALVSRQELPRVVRVLGINPDRIIALSQLPDVEVNRTYNGTGKLPGGVTGTAAPKELPAGSWWVRKVGAMSLAEGREGDLGAFGTVENFWPQTKALLTTLNFTQDQIVFLTDKQAERFDPTGKRRLTTEVERRAIKYAAKHNFSTRFVGEKNASVFKRTFSRGFSSWYNELNIIDSEAHDWIRNRVMVDLGLGSDDPECWTASDNNIAEIAGITFEATLTSEEIKSKVDEYKKAFPLLFIDGGVSLTEFYIQKTIEQENQK